MYWMGWSEMFYRLFRASWLPGAETVWRVASNPTSQNPQRYADLPFDGLLMDFLVLIVVLLLVDWMIKALRRHV